MSSPDEPASGKVCRDCTEFLGLDALSRARSRADGRGTYCSSCYAVRNRAHRVKKAAVQGRTVTARRAVPEGTAYCPRCQTVKPLVDFGRNAGSAKGRTTYCKPCHNAVGWAEKVRLYGGSRSYHLKRRYGVTASEVDEMIAAQGAASAPSVRSASPSTSTTTGAVRGVLCSCCNQGLGNVRDRVDLLREAATYLHRTTRQPCVVREQPGVYAVRPSVG